MGREVLGVMIVQKERSSRLDTVIIVIKMIIVVKIFIIIVSVHIVKIHFLQVISGRNPPPSVLDNVDLPVTLTPCLGEWLENQDHYVTLSDMHPRGGCHVLQLLHISLDGENPTGEIMLHDGVHYITCKVSLTFDIVVFNVGVSCVCLFVCLFVFLFKQKHPWL